MIIYDNRYGNSVVYVYLALVIPISVSICILYIIYKINTYFLRLQIQEERIGLNCNRRLNLNFIFLRYWNIFTRTFYYT